MGTQQALQGWEGRESASKGLPVLPSLSSASPQTAQVPTCGGSGTQLPMKRHDSGQPSQINR